MAKKGLLLITVLLFFGIQLFGQIMDKEAQSYLERKGEVYFSFTLTDKSKLRELGRIVSIDNVKESTITAYANKETFDKFCALHIPYSVLKHPGDMDVNPKMSDFKDKSANIWDAYPTYEGYIAMMNQSQTDHTGICSVFSIGNTTSARKMMVAKISSNVSTHEAKPRVLLMSTIHGDETTGYVLLLRMIDYLTSNYNVDSRITNLINTHEIWICPLLNPDGTYAGGNNTVNGAKRYNTNGIDINRNFKNPVGGLHPDGEKAYAMETINMMHLYDSLHFTMSFVMHGGAEVFNYPFDSWEANAKYTNNPKTHADDNWWQAIGKAYVDTTRKVYANYMKDVDPSGYVNGGDWYVVEGSCQDYETYYCLGREVTIEVSSTKLPSASQLPNYWNYNYRAVLNYIELASKGITGTVTDSCTGQPLRAKIEIISHDRDSSHIYSEADLGDYHRPIAAGTYSMRFSATGYQDYIQNGVTPTTGNTTTVNIKLKCITSSLIETKSDEIKIYPNPANNNITISNLPKEGAYISIINPLGRLISAEKLITTQNQQLDISTFNSGVYFLRIRNNSGTSHIRFIKQ